MLFVIVVTIMLIVFTTLPGSRTRVAVFAIATIFDFANLAVVTGLPLFAGYTWSISAEEQFYLVWPFVLTAGLARFWDTNRTRKRFALWMVAATAFAAILRTVLGASVNSAKFLYYSPLTHADGILLGCTVALMRAWSLWGFGRYASPSWVRAVAVGGLVVMVFLLNENDYWLYMVGYPFVLGVAMILILASCDSIDRRLDWLASSAMGFAGKISYSLYLWSSFILIYFEGSVLWRGLGVAASVVVSVFTYRYIERPALSLKKRLMTRRHFELTTKPSLDVRSVELDST